MTAHELRERLAKIEDEQEMGDSGLVLINNNSVWVGEITKLWIDNEGDEPTVILDKERGIDEGVILEYPVKKKGWSDERF